MAIIWTSTEPDEFPCARAAITPARPEVKKEPATGLFLEPLTLSYLKKHLLIP
jgi:hypothetical protein